MKIDWKKWKNKLCVILGHNFVCLARHTRMDVSTLKAKDEYTAWWCTRCGCQKQNTFKYKN